MPFLWAYLHISSIGLISPTTFVIWAILITLVLGVTTALIGPKKKGYYIFSAIIFVVLAVIFFTISSTWLESTVNWGGTAGHQGKPLGVGPWFAGLAASFSAIGSIVANRMSK